MRKTLCALVLAGALATGAFAAPAQALTITATQAGDRTISFSSDAAGVTVWDFGDGTTGPAPAATTHTYASAGARHVTLSDTVPDPTDPTGVATITTVATADIHVYATPTASFTYDVLANGRVQFHDQSTGEPQTWTWSWTGGSVTGQNPPAQSLPIGTTQVTLTVGNPAGQNSSTLAVGVNGAPTANFTIAPNPAAIGAPVTFTSTSTDPNGDALTYAWDLGNGAAPGSVAAAATSYAAAGTYLVTLTVTDPSGASSSRSQQVTIANTPPVANFTILSTPTGTDTPVTFTSTSTDAENDALTYAWDFDNGLVGTGPVATTSFADPGAYLVVLTVTDSHGASSSRQQLVTVLADKPPSVSLSFAPENPSVGDPVRFTATASDPDGTVSAIDWDLDNDGQFGDGTGSVVSRAFTTPGARIVAVRATDNMGVATIAFRTVVVTGSSAASSATASTPGSAPLSSPQGSAPSSRHAPILSPFPIVRIRGAILRGAARINLLSVKAPVGATVRVVCHGKGCGKRKAVKQRVKSPKSVRVHAFERVLKRGTVIEVFVTEKGMVGKYTSFRVRSNAAPARNDLCLAPGRSKPTSCAAL